jgi:murein DD-endopeptidase MepM/ murein hydrolase activator NlpD
MTVELEQLVRIFPVRIPPAFVPRVGGGRSPTDAYPVPIPAVFARLMGGALPPQGGRAHRPPYRPTIGAGVDAIRPGGFTHDAVDVAAAYGAEVLATCDGTIFGSWTYRGHTRPGAGYLDDVAGYVRVDGPEHYVVYYAHLLPIVVRPGQAVRTGQLLGYSFHKGVHGGPAHLHFQIRQPSPGNPASGGRRVNPEDRLRTLLGHLAMP